ncbi:MAG: restriction endonuclease, partial [Myxococcota bacterium]
ASINLAAVDPKACFRKLKGVGSSQLHSLAPVAPLAKIASDDERFVDSYEVASTLDEGENLASMDWEDFEHLVREVFEHRFARDGGEVRVTRASRDGGIDAVAFDPDPVTGGKIVIQAKRYTRTVQVAAVRELYGVVQREGAKLGILVTTADYGPDAYQFASGVPVNLISGSELLHMLQEMGRKVRIDLAAARSERS